MTEDQSSVDNKEAQQTPNDGASAPSLAFPKEARLRSPAEFEAVYRLKQKVTDGTLLCFGQWQTLGRTRIGLSVSRKRGNAVKRNREKRLLREAFRLTQHDLPPNLDLVLIPISTQPLTLEGLKESLGRLAKKFVRRFPQTGSGVNSSGE